MKNKILKCYIVALLITPFFLTALLYTMPNHKVTSEQLVLVGISAVIGWIAGLLVIATCFPKKSKVEVSQQSGVGYYGDECVLMIGNEIVNL